jgi:hypothetical protein
MFSVDSPEHPKTYQKYLYCSLYGFNHLLAYMIHLKVQEMIYFRLLHAQSNDKFYPSLLKFCSLFLRRRMEHYITYG